MRGIARGATYLAARLSRAVALRQSEKRLDGDFDEETLAKDIDREDDAVGIARIVDEALKTEERAADDFDAATLGKKGASR